MEEEEMTKVCVATQYLEKLMLQDLRRRWNRQNKEFGFEDKFEPDNFEIDFWHML
mgnify:CR=1 FL=1